MEKIKILEIIAVYFRAMLTGYFSGEKNPPNVKKDKEHGETIITYVEGDFIVEDRYSPNFGTTKVYWKGLVVWIMFYWGTYPKVLIPVLGKALQPVFQQGIWNGGRGPTGRERIVIDGKEYLYSNIVFENDPANFAGEEAISAPFPGGSDICGYHKYAGKAVESLVDCSEYSS